MKLSGIIQSGPVDVGSKHEHVGYHITTPEGRTARLFHVGDDPFEGNLLAPYDGHRVELQGEFDSRNANLFIVHEIHTVS